MQAGSASASRQGQDAEREARPGPQLREQGPQGPQEQASGSARQGHSPQRRLWASGPRQGEPPRGGAEATQTRVRTWFPPPQETGQSDQADHGVQAPSPAGGSREVREIRGTKRQRVGRDPQHTGASGWKHGRRETQTELISGGQGGRASRVGGLGMNPQTCTLGVFTYDALRGAGAEGGAQTQGRCCPAAWHPPLSAPRPCPRAHHCWHPSCSQLSPRERGRVPCRHRGGHGD